MSIVAINLMALGRAADGLELAEEAMTIAERVGAPSVIGIAANALSGAIADTDPERAAALADRFLTRAERRRRPRCQPRTGNARAQWPTRRRPRCGRRATEKCSTEPTTPAICAWYSCSSTSTGRSRPDRSFRGFGGALRNDRGDAQHLATPCRSAGETHSSPASLKRSGTIEHANSSTQGEGLEIADAIRLAREELDRVIEARRAPESPPFAVTPQADALRSAFNSSSSMAGVARVGLDHQEARAYSPSARARARIVAPSR